MTEPQGLVATLLETQAHYCGMIGSRLYERLLELSAEDVRAGGPVWEALAGHADDPPNSMFPLRLLGAVHRLVLAGEAPELGRFYPSAGGKVDLKGAWPAFVSVLGERRGRLEEEIGAHVQTNEVGRCAALLGGFLTVAERFRLPLALLEVGASAGLNLRWDRYLYRSGDRGFGPAGSPVRFEQFVASGEFPFGAEATVSARRGCDASPLDPGSERDRLLLRSFVWPDQLWRFEALSAALEIAREMPVAVARADAGEWVEQQLEQREQGVATVVFHSMVMMYLSDSSKERMTGAIERAGREASEDAPLAWLRMELGGDEADVSLTIWPPGEERTVARTGYHGPPVRWL